MDHYDEREGGQVYSFSHRDSESKDSLCVSVPKILIFVCNIILLATGIAALVLAVYLNQSGNSLSLSDTSEDFGQLDDLIFGLLIAAAILIIVISFLGCCAAWNESRCLTILFVTIITLTLLVEVAIMVVLLEGSYTKSMLKEQWNASSRSQQDRIEEDLKCCSFDHPTPPECQAGDISCYDKIKDNVRDMFDVIAFVLLGVAVYQLIMMMLGCCLCCAAGDRKGSKGRQVHGDEV